MKACLCALQVCQLANYLKSIGVKRGSDVTIYMPMIPELPAAMVIPNLHPSKCHVSLCLMHNHLPA